MFWRIVDFGIAILCLVGAGFAAFGDFQLNNQDLTKWVLLALFIIFWDNAFKLPKRGGK